MKILIISFLSLIFSETLVPNKKIKINAGEPSGIYCSNGNCIISSDDGNVYSFNPENYQIENLKIFGEDFEGVTISGNNIYLIEERSRKLLKYDNEFQLLKTVTLPYSGRLNRGYEGVTHYNGNLFVITEKNPCLLTILNKDLQITNHVLLNIKEASDIIIYKDELLVLSEQDHCIYVLDITNYKIKKKFNLNLIGAEGICMYKNQMLITSDKLSTVYFFDIPEL